MLFLQLPILECGYRDGTKVERLGRQSLRFHLCCCVITLCKLFAPLCAILADQYTPPGASVMDGRQRRCHNLPLFIKLRHRQIMLLGDTVTRV